MLKDLEHAQQIARLTDRLLKDAGAYGRFPTPVDDIVEAAKLERSETSALSDLFVKRAPAFIRKAVEPLKSKIRAILDRRERVVHLHPEIDEHEGRRGFKILHEVSHDIYPWQSDLAYADDDLTLAWSTRMLFEQEANQGAAELFFQRKLFAKVASDYEIGFGAVLDLAQKFGASIHATFRRYVETHRGVVAGVVIKPSGSGKEVVYRRREAAQSAGFRDAVGPTFVWPRVLENPPFDFLSLLASPYQDEISSTTFDLLLPSAAAEGLRLKVELFSNTYSVFALLWRPMKKKFKKRVVVKVDSPEVRPGRRQHRGA